MREKITVLIADDNQEFSMTLATYLKNQDDMVVVGRANDGNEALDMIPNLMPDVVLLDVIMPHLDGIGVLEKLNMIKLSKKPICIMLSAVGQDKITRRAVELGAEYYFNTDASNLSIAQCAFLAGINNSPNRYNPYSETDHTELIKKRTKTVLGQMKKLRIYKSRRI